MYLSWCFSYDGLVFLSQSDGNAAAKTQEKKQHLIPAVLDVTKTEPFSRLTAIEVYSVSITCMIYTDNEAIGYLENI